MTPAPQLAARAAFLFFAMTMIAPAQTRSFDGTWWQSANPDERDGFIDGFADCAVWSGHNMTYNATPEQISEKITEKYDSDPANLHRPVTEIWRQLGTRKTSSDGEKWSDPHWWFTGTWWLTQREPHQIGYVEGFLHCSKVLDIEQTYSHEPVFYKERIERDLQGSKRPNKEYVATVLQHYRDQKQKGTK